MSASTSSASSSSASRNGEAAVFISNFISGGLSGICSKSLAAPVERVKLLLQTQKLNEQLPKSQRYTGPLDCIKKVYSSQGRQSASNIQFISSLYLKEVACSHSHVVPMSRYRFVLEGKCSFYRSIFAKSSFKLFI